MCHTRRSPFLPLNARFGKGDASILMRLPYQNARLGGVSRVGGMGDQLSEDGLRDKLGIPLDAPQVLVVAESTHWDPNWLLTSEEYFRLRVRRTLDNVITELLHDPRRVFSLECTFFPNLYWDRRPGQRPIFRELVNTGRLRFTGSGVTTPDTLIPDDELLLHDLLEGQEWLRARGMTQELRLLYLPDSFGHSPGTPALLRAAGVPYATICRIDGMAFPGAEWESSKNFPRPGSTAARLTNERTTDFVWRAPDGSEVLTHWNAYGYGHGDMIASRGVTRWMGLPGAWSSRGEAPVAKRIERRIEELSRLSRTPYLLLAAGFDFVNPIPRLLDLIDRWNDARYERTGVWMVNAGLDDHLDLVAHHRHRLPTIELDPNPYWMGFYASRPALKRAARSLGHTLRLADSTAAERVLTGLAPDERADGKRAEAWWVAATSNHHDFITGTSPDRVTTKEQWRWLNRATDLARSASESSSPIPVLREPESSPTTGSPTHVDEGADQLVNEDADPGVNERSRGGAGRGGAGRDGAGRDGARSDGATGAGIHWHRDGTAITVTTPDLRAVFDEARGGALVHLATTNDGIALIDGPALVLIAYAESGGLWRMGHEFRGGKWAAANRSDVGPGKVTVQATPTNGVDVHIETTVAGVDQQLTVTLEPASTVLVVSSEVTVPDRHTITLSVPTTATLTDSPDDSPLLMHQPGGVVARPLARWYDPTFWPLHSFAVAISDIPAIGPNVAVAASVPTALHARVDGTIEIVVGRNAIKEQAFGLLPVPAHPAKGREREPQHQRLALAWMSEPRTGAPLNDGHPTDDHPNDEARRTALVRLGRNLCSLVDPLATPPFPVAVDHPDVEVIAVKPAHRGSGVIVRLRNWGPPTHVDLRVSSGSSPILAASITDALERDIRPLPAGNLRQVPVDHHLTTIRLVPNPAPKPAPNTGQDTGQDTGRVVTPN